MTSAIKGGKGFEIAVGREVQGGSLQTEIAKLKAAASTKYGQGLANFEFRLVTRDQTSYLQIKEQTWFGRFKESHHFGQAERTAQRSGAVELLRSVYGEQVSRILADQSQAADKSVDQTSSRALLQDIGAPLKALDLRTEGQTAPALLDPVSEPPAAPLPVFNPEQPFNELPTGDFVVGMKSEAHKTSDTVVIHNLSPILIDEQMAAPDKAPTFDKADLPKGLERRASVAVPRSARDDIPMPQSKSDSASAAILKAEQEAKDRIESNSYEIKIRLAQGGAESTQGALEIIEKRANLASCFDADDAKAIAENLIGPRKWGNDIASIAIDALRGLDISNDDDEQIAVFADLLNRKAVHLVGESNRRHPAHDAFVNFKAKAEHFVIFSKNGYGTSLKLVTLMQATKLTAPDVIDVLDHHEAYLSAETGSDLRASLEAAIGRAYANNATDRDLELIEQFFSRPQQSL